MTGATVYFAYGSNLCTKQMAWLCPGFVTLERARLDDYRLTFPRGDSLLRCGVAGIERDPGAYVEGVLYQITQKHLGTLDEFEGVAGGDYTRRMVTVKTPEGWPRRAITYFATPQPGGPFAPSQSYLDRIIRGAIEHGLPAEWIDHLHAFAMKA